MTSSMVAEMHDETHCV